MFVLGFVAGIVFTAFVIGIWMFGIYCAEKF